MYKKNFVSIFSAFMLISATSLTSANTITVPMYLTAANGQGKNIGSIKIEDSVCGILLTPNLHDLPPGMHGFHVHEKAACGHDGMDAGGHFDPAHTAAHDGPYQTKGHQGDLPILYVNSNGTATLPTLAPHLTLAALRGHSLMIHAGGDNYSDQPEKLGGGGARIACGIFPM